MSKPHAGSLSSRGNEFQTVGLEIENARRPYVLSRQRGTISCRHCERPANCGMDNCCAEVKSIDELKSTIAQLYGDLNVEQYQLKRERELQSHLDDLHRQIEPFEQVQCH